MFKRLLTFSVLILAVTQIAVTSDREDDVARTKKATQVFKEIMDTPDWGIPHDLLDKAQCIAIIPGDKKFAFIFGATYGRGIATCRTPHGWSAPLFVALDGGSVGYQIGGSSTDLVMLFMNRHALQSLLSDISSSWEPTLPWPQALWAGAPQQTRTSNWTRRFCPILAARASLPASVWTVPSSNRTRVETDPCTEPL
jgi:hypothetical protein